MADNLKLIESHKLQNFNFINNTGGSGPSRKNSSLTKLQMSRERLNSYQSSGNNQEDMNIFHTRSPKRDQTSRR